MRRSKRNADRPRVVYYGERPREEKQADISVGALLGASPDAGTRRNLAELSALGQMEAAARERDEAEEVARQRRKARRSTIASRASLGTPHAHIHAQHATHTHTQHATYQCEVYYLQLMSCVRNRLHAAGATPNTQPSHTHTHYT